LPQRKQFHALAIPSILEGKLGRRKGSTERADPHQHLSSHVSFTKPPHNAASFALGVSADANTNQVWDLTKRAPAFQCAIRQGLGLLTL
jgi:hypothetical protein